jgi:hypothetical protein
MNYTLSPPSSSAVVLLACLDAASNWGHTKQTGVDFAVMGSHGVLDTHNMDSMLLSPTVNIGFPYMGFWALRVYHVQPCQEPAKATAPP